MQTEDGSGDGFCWTCKLEVLVNMYLPANWNNYLPISTPNRIKLQRPVAMEQSTGH